MPNIAELPGLLSSIDGVAREDIDRLFRIDDLEGLLDVPETFRPKVARWCGAADVSSRAWSAIQCQRIVSVHNRWTYESCNFNPLRSSKPLPVALQRATPDEIAEASEGPGKCDFCDLENFTAVEPFGRIRGTCCMTAGNAFKSAGLHGLLVWARHAPHKLTVGEVEEGFRTADAWYERAMAWDQSRGSGRARHEILFWNCFRNSGASQIHPHMQMQLFEGPMSQEALFADQTERYRQLHPGDDLCRLIARAHGHLGLAASRGELDAAGCGEVEACWASLTPRVGGGELVVLGQTSPAGQRPAVAGVASAVAAMQAALRAGGAEAISTCGSHVAREAGGRAWMIRCWGRGQAEAATSADMGSTELLGVTGSWSDPFHITARLRAVLAAAACERAAEAEEGRQGQAPPIV